MPPRGGKMLGTKKGVRSNCERTPHMFLISFLLPRSYSGGGGTDPGLEPPPGGGGTAGSVIKFRQY